LTKVQGPIARGPTVLISREEVFIQHNDHEWLIDLSFVVDIINHINKFNLQLQGKNKTIGEMTGYVNLFKSKLRLISSQLMMKELKNFPHMSDELLKMEVHLTTINTTRKL
jgi:hypothetical protein